MRGADDNRVSTASEEPQGAATAPARSGRAAAKTGRGSAMARYELPAPHLHEGAPLARLAAGQGESGVTYRTLQRWLAAYRRGGL